MTAATLARTSSVPEDTCEFPHVLDGVVLDGAAARLARMLERDFLDEAGWDPRMRVLSLPAQHRLLGRRVCRADGCERTVHSGLPAVCLRCFTRLTGLGLSATEIATAAQLPAAPPRARITARCQDASASRRCGRRCCASRTPGSSERGGHEGRWSSSSPIREFGVFRRCRNARWRPAPGWPTARAATATPTISAGEQPSEARPSWTTAGGRSGNRGWPGPGSQSARDARAGGHRDAVRHPAARPWWREDHRCGSAGAV